ncbi:hypothetical protein [Micromonospora sp. WMMD712]|uniref:hypothetical protein n=1 Tax=Micromonospora sp. WMMD712 TaxID=3016096 RepID=UPI00249A47E5|nr:hypothetical protein [Micromonospora sp. WMMD712]WFE55684.1 hypothetical protein O7633_01895 [Micromonospora sp. WMMD712]
MIEPAGPDPLPAVPEDDGRRATGDRPRVLLVVLLAALVFLVPVTIVFLATEGIDRADKYASVFGLFAGISSVLLGLVSLLPRRRDRQAGPGDGAGPGGNAPGGGGTGTGGGPRSRQRSRTFGFTAGVVGTTILSCTVATTTQSSLNAPPPVDEPPPLAVVAAVDWAWCDGAVLAAVSPARLPAPPRRYTSGDWADWFTRLGGARTGAAWVTLTLRSRSDATVTVTGIRAAVAGRSEPPEVSTTVGVACGGPGGDEPGGDELRFDLDAEPARSTGGVRFPLAVTRSVSVLPVRAQSGQPRVLSWRLEIDWVSQDRRGTLTVDELDGLPLLTGGEGRSRCFYTETGTIIESLSGEGCPTR